VVDSSKVIVALEDLGTLVNPPVQVGKELKFLGHSFTMTDPITSIEIKPKGRNAMVVVKSHSGVSMAVRMSIQDVVLPATWLEKHPLSVYVLSYHAFLAI
jgi:hydrogenase maturation factor